MSYFVFFILKHSCFLRDGTWETTLFLIPVLVLSGINLVIFLIIFHLIRRLSRERNQGVTVAQVVSLMALVTSFGLAWLFSVVALANKEGEARDVFSGIFIVLSQMQGSFLFLLYCAAKKEVRIKYLELFGYRKVTTTSSEFSGKLTTKTNVGMHSLAPVSKMDQSVTYNTYFEPNKEADKATLVQNGNGTPVTNLEGNVNEHQDSVQF